MPSGLSGFHRIGNLFKSRCGAPKQGTLRLGDANRSRRADKKRRIEPVFQRFQLMTNRRRLQAQTVRCPFKAARVRNRIENFNRG